MLHEKIPQLEAHEDIRAVLNHHSPKPGERIKVLDQIYHGKAQATSARPVFAVVHDHPEAAGYESQAGEIHAERERQRIASERLKAEWQEKQRQKQLAQQSGQ